MKPYNKIFKTMILDKPDRVQSRLERIRIHRAKSERALRDRFEDGADDVPAGIRIKKPFYSLKGAI